jgi:hypothetical protein
MKVRKDINEGNKVKERRKEGNTPDTRVPT